MEGTGEMLLTASGDRVIAEQLADELAGVEKRFGAELRSSLACVNSLVGHMAPPRD